MDEARIDRPFDMDETPGETEPAAEPEENGNGEDEAAVDEDTPDAIVDTGELEVVENPENDLENQIKNTNERLLRVAADFENYRKRIEREKGNYLKYANERLLRDLLTVTDNLDRAVDSARSANDSKAITDGVGLVLSDLIKVLAKYGVKPMLVKGRPFDPLFHEAIQTAETDEVEPGTILEEVQRGYTMNDRVLRAALVVVSASPEETSPGVEIPVEVSPLPKKEENE